MNPRLPSPSSPLLSSVLRSIFLASLALHPLLGSAQEDTWQELASEPPPNFSTEELQAFAVAPGSALRYGVDPKTLTVGSDGVVRYVMVARSRSGALNVLYEGIRCSSGETKIYAQWSQGSAWRQNGDAEWQPLSELGLTHHSRRLARDAVCDGPTPNGSPSNILRAMQRGQAMRLE